MTRTEPAGASGPAPERRLVAGRYHLLAPLGEGGMGTVWQARDEVLHREVALKEIRPPAGMPQAAVRRMCARLETEARAAARVSHPGVVTVHDVVTHEGLPWIVMELVPGAPLSALLESGGPLPPRQAARIGADVLAALSGAHAAGVLHRDVKPSNVLVTPQGRVVVTDFGIARIEGGGALTLTGELVGSAGYLPPERVLGRAYGPAADLWALGALLYAAVEGVPPFLRATTLATLRAVTDEEPPRARRAGALGPVIAGLLRRDPAARPGAAEAERALRAVAAGAASAPRLGRPVPPASAGQVTLTAPSAPRAARWRRRPGAVAFGCGLFALTLALGLVVLAWTGGG